MIEIRITINEESKEQAQAKLLDVFSDIYLADEKSGNGWEIIDNDSIKGFIKDEEL